jgi:outer membrane receptor for ferrienterochelin and colicin
MNTTFQVFKDGSFWAVLFFIALFNPLKSQSQGDTSKIAQVEISSRFEEQQKALEFMQRADNILNVISSQQIKLFPDVNAAEAIQRISGITLQRDQGEGRFVQLRGTPPQLTNFNINGEQIPSPEGDVRFVGLDVIAADQIEKIEVKSD